VSAREEAASNRRRRDRGTQRPPWAYSDEWYTKRERRERETE
jgi:hypothetical protein